MTRLIVFGIDLDAHGAVAILDAGELIEVHETPKLEEVAGRPATNAPLLAAILAKTHTRVAYCEFVSARPTDACSGFRVRPAARTYRQLAPRWRYLPKKEIAMPDADAKRATSAERTRSYRERRRSGSTLVRLIISADGASELIRLGWLSPGSARDPSAVANALLALAGEAAVKGLRPPRAPART